MRYTRKGVYLLTLLSVTLIALIAGLIIQVLRPVATQLSVYPTPVPAQAVSLSISSTLPPEAFSLVYIVRDRAGFICVFDSAGKLVEPTDVRTDGLRQTDQALLRDGISVYGLDNLLKLLEDFAP